MNKGTVICIIAVFSLMGVDSGFDKIEQRIISDSTLVVPGKGSEKLLIGEELSAALRRLKKSYYKIAKPKVKAELFKNVFKVISKIEIIFQYMYYFEENKTIIFVHSGKVVAIASFNTYRVTEDAVDLNRGLNNFIYNYGNENCDKIITASHRVYVFFKRGIAVIDDNRDDNIDGYIVFSPIVENPGEGK